MKKMLHRGFNPSKCKTSLKMAVSRLKLLRNKKEIQLTQLKREVAQLLETGQDQTARIRVEHVVREEKTITAYELIDIYCELIVARLPIIETQKNCPIDLKEAIASIIFATPRCSDIPELVDIRKHFLAKYGKEFVTAAVELRPDCGVNRTLIEKLSANAPDGPTKVKILTGIAEEHKIKWEPNWFKDNEPEAPAHEPTEKIKMHPSYELKPEIPSNIHHGAGPEVNDPRFAYSAARPSGTEPETVEPSQSPGGAGSSSFVARQKWSMDFKDASAAASAAAESAEMASMAARAAVELASRGKLVDSSVESDFAENESIRAHMPKADQGSFVDKFSAGNSLRESPSRMGNTQRDPHIDVKPSGMMNGGDIEKDYPQTVEYDTPNFSQQSNSPKKVMQKDENRTGRRTTGEVNQKPDHRQSFKRYNEVQDDVEIEEHQYTSPEDSELWTSTSSQAPLKYEHDIFSYSNRPHDDGSVENPFHEETVETRNQPSTHRSQPSSFSENYGIMPNSDPPKFDDDLNDEDPFDSTGRSNFYKEDFETKKPLEESTFHSTVFHDQKEDIFAFSERRKYAFELHKQLFTDGDDDSLHMEKESTNAEINDAAPQFDDYVADEDTYIQSPGRESPDYSSPDEERLPKKSGVSSTKHLYQPELTESFKKSPFYSQLVKPISLGDESDDSENDEEVKISKIHEKTSARNIHYNLKEPETEHTDPNEFVGSSYGRRGTTSIISEESTVEQDSVENLEKESSDFNRKKAGSSDLSTGQRSSRGTRSRSDAKSFDRQSFSRLLEEAERLSSPRRSRLQATPDAIDESQDSYQSNSESSIGLNVDSLTGGLKNKGLRLPPYTRGTSTYTSSVQPVDDAPKLSQPSSSLEGTYFDPNDDDPTENVEQKGLINIRNSSDMKFSDNLNQRSSSRVPKSYLDSKDISSEEEDVQQIVPSKYRSAAGSSRRTRAGQSYAAGSQTAPKTSSMLEKETSSSTSFVVDTSVKPRTKPVIQMESLEPRRRDDKTRPSQTEKRASSSTMESASRKETSSSSSFPVDTSVKPRTKSVTQMESLEPQRRDDKTRKSHLSKMSPGEEISSPSVAGKPATTDPPKTSNSKEKTLSRESSDKKASHVHPKLPDYDDFASHFLSLRKDRQ